MGGEVKLLMTQGTSPFAQRVAKLLPAGHAVRFAAAILPEALLHTGNYLAIPRADVPAFVHELLKACLDGQVEALLPLGAAELHPLAGARQLFAEYGIDVWVPSVGELDGLAVIANPPRPLPLMVLRNGAIVGGAADAGPRYGALSGVFALSDGGDEPALCCVAD